MNKQEKVKGIAKKEPCGCEFTHYGGTCYLTKCVCEKHRNADKIGEWYDHEGYHCEEIKEGC